MNAQERAAALPPEVRSLYPFRGKLLALQNNANHGSTLHYLDEGSGSPVLFVHGNPTWSFYWRRLVQEFSRDHRCIAVDHIGCGLSDKPEDYPYTLAQHVENLAELIETLDLRDITLVVHDWGGPIGLGAALRHRDRIRRVVIFNTGCFDGPIPWNIRMCRVPVLGALAIRGLNGFVRAGLLQATANRKHFAGAVGQGFLAPYANWAERVAHLRFVQDIPLEADHPTRALFLSIGEHVRVFNDRPVAIVWGEKDFCFVPHFRHGFVARLPNAEVTVFEDAGHWVVEDAHDRIVPLLRDFFARHPIGAAA